MACYFCISLFKWERWGKFDFVYELRIWEGREADGRTMYMSVLNFSTLCLCWILHVWFLEAMSRWIGYWEITLRVNSPYGVRKDRTVLLSMQGHTYSTPQSSLTSSDLWQYVYWPGPLLLWFVCLQLSRKKLPSALFPVPSCCLTLERHIHFSHCYQTLAVLFP